MRTTSFSGMNCSVAGALEAIGDRWSLLILRDLLLGVRRFDALQASSDIPPQTLARRLRHLEAAGLVVRRRYQDRPARYDYHLTAKGGDLLVVVTALRESGDRWQLHGTSGPPLESIDHTTGHPVELAFVDTVTDQHVERSRLAAHPGPGADERMLRRLQATRSR